MLQGLEAVDKAIEIKSDYMEAVAYKNLLLRLQANLEKDPAKQQALLREADQLRDKADRAAQAEGGRRQLGTALGWTLEQPPEPIRSASMSLARKKGRSAAGEAALFSVCLLRRNAQVVSSDVWFESRHEAL